MAKIWAIVMCIFTLIYTLCRTIVYAVIPTRLRPRKSIKDCIALVTGGGNGLGRELSLRLSKLGATLVVLDVDQTGLEETCARIRANGGQAKGYHCDVSNREQIYKVAAQVKDDVGTVSILVNNAGVANGKMLLDIPDDAIQKVFDINIMSHFWTTKAFLPGMIKSQKGHIVGIASVAGYCAMPKATEYVSAKHAVVGFMEALKFELLELGSPMISTTTICPYFIDTGMFTCKYDGLLPMLKTKDVVDKIIEGVLLEKERVMIPSSFNFYVPLKMCLDSHALHAVMNVMGGRRLINSIKLTRAPCKQ